eukprot:4746976-Heterocapsa_arctica.AAC.1
MAHESSTFDVPFMNPASALVLSTNCIRSRPSSAARQLKRGRTPAKPSAWPICCLRGRNWTM